VAQHMAHAHLFLNAADRDEDRGPGARYEFSHVLHHQVIYDQLPLLRRQRLHRTIAEALESTSGERVAEMAPELSIHFQRGGDPLRAAKYLGLCVARAQQRHAPHEAIACGELAVELLGRVPDSPERRQRELEVRLLLGVSLNLTRGFSAPAVRENYERARALCESEGSARPLFEIMHAVWYAQMVATKFDAARETIDELVRLVQPEPGSEFHLRVDLARGRSEFWSGHFPAAIEIFTRFLEDAAEHPIAMRAQTYGEDPTFVAYGHGSLALWFLGRPDQARTWAAKGMAWAEEHRDPFSLASALTHSTFVELACGNAEGATRLAARTKQVAAEHMLAMFDPMGRFFHGAALAAHGDVGAGLAEMLPALEEHRAVLGPLISDIMLGLLAETYVRAERWDEGLRSVDEGLAVSDQPLYAAELWRIKGELLLGKARSAKKTRAVVNAAGSAARRCLHRAVRIARGQQARSLELSIAMSLARLSAGTKGAADAHAQLRAIIASFTEGLDTKDVKDAQALLNTRSR